MQSTIKSMKYLTHRTGIWLSTIASILLVVVIKLLTVDPISKNGFTRDKNKTTNLLKIINLPESNNYFAGSTANHLYIGNINSPYQIKIFTDSLTDSTNHHLNYEGRLDVYKDVGRLSVDSPIIHFSEGMTPAFFTGNLSSLHLQNDYDSVSFFLSSHLLYGSTWVMNSYSKVDKQRILLKKSPTTIGQNVKFLPEKQIDGTFCTQGSLSYDRENHILIYTFSYRNRFICLDTNLTPLYKGNTIDTNSIAKLKVERINDNKSKLSAPPVVINRSTFIDNGILYVQSALFGDNEDPRDYEGMTPIDQYSTKSGEYIGSFLVPKALNHLNIESFLVSNKTLFALYGNQLAAFTIRTKVQKVTSRIHQQTEYTNKY